MASFNLTKEPEDVFHDRVNFIYPFLESNYTQLGIPDPETDLKAPLDGYNTKYATAKLPDRPKTAVTLRKEARATLTDELNKYGKEYLFNNHNLTLNDKLLLGIHIDKTDRTKVPKPDGKVAIVLSYGGGSFSVAVQLGPEAGAEELDPRSDYGYVSDRGMMPPGGATLEQAASAKHYLMTPPVSGDELQYYKFTRKKKEIVAFDPHEAGMTAYFCSRYENQKGEAGEWGRIISIVVPS
jgi:hypothetical protein